MSKSREFPAHGKCPEVKAVAVCPSCFLALPATGFCAECES